MAASVGIVSPISSVSSTNRDFTETREEIQRLIDEDSTYMKKEVQNLVFKVVKNIGRLCEKNLSSENKKL